MKVICSLWVLFSRWSPSGWSRSISQQWKSLYGLNLSISRVPSSLSTDLWVCSSCFIREQLRTGPLMRQHLVSSEPFLNMDLMAQKRCEHKLSALLQSCALIIKKTPLREHLVCLKISAFRSSKKLCQNGLRKLSTCSTSWTAPSKCSQSQSLQTSLQSFSSSLILKHLNWRRTSTSPLKLCSQPLFFQQTS